MNQNQKKPAALEPNIIFTTLRGMISKQWSYEGKQFIITDAIEHAADFKIYTTAGSKVLNPTDANTFIAGCVFIENELPQAANPSVIAAKTQAVAPVQEAQVISKQGAMIDSMTDALFDVFQNIRENPSKENIDMGTALSNTANTICNMMKLKLQAEKLSKKGI